jgi:hypothetical protein
MKQITGIPSLAEFYFFLRDCKPLNAFMEFKWNNKILYHLLPEPNLAESIASIMMELKPDSEEDTLSMHMPPLTENPNHQVTPARHNLSNIQDAIDTTLPASQAEDQTQDIESVISSGTVNHLIPADLTGDLNSYYVHDNCLPTDTEFVVFHCLVFDTIQNWATSAPPKTHPFVITWNKWK